ncbi:PREDICTED: uncharacterized protein LOC108374983 isoform X4 [Rhagoletis zephyria]|uniref:uncharacterized protein LOC108358624 isoform X4 n=1 Tax=Rhagoletis zephyria TaxID=28612 RepID=UPI0008119F10|nr:PREDICTED: uncharacterized protein LOC108358624 isoform X4 [Rhagoletis zephyria]XP_017486537.1 PREDICTED: uncharacterized protein LOC108374983 isoform X4 [Rhagoletis zephyria]XP_036343173.1 uncharacterized protein LOC118752379 isoform X2 [Rhagoletis pomonella]
MKIVVLITEHMQTLFFIAGMATLYFCFVKVSLRELSNCCELITYGHVMCKMNRKGIRSPTKNRLISSYFQKELPAQNSDPENEGFVN